jgi:nucleoside-diphosphate-sugar epimerase
VILKSGKASGYISLSLHEKPDTTTLSVFGDDGAIHADYFGGVITHQRTPVLPRAANRLMHGYRAARQSFAGASGTVFQVATGNFDKTAGMTQLVQCFYDSIRGRGPAPLTPERLLNTAKLIDAVWPEPSAGMRIAQETVLRHRSHHDAPKARALVTGASGFIGTHILDKLAEEGVPARALVRPNSINAGKLIGTSVEVVEADLTDAEAMLRACEGIETVIHAGAATASDWASNEQATINGTRHILAAARQQGVKKMVHVSTLSVYELLDKARNEVVTEESAYQKHPRRMGAYAACKIEAEKLVKQAMASGGIGIAIVRPGMVIGEGGFPFFPHLGFNLGGKLFLAIGKGAVPLPFTYVGNLVDAIYRAATLEAASGRIYNIVDDARVTARRYLEKFIEVTGIDGRVVNLPYIVPYTAIGAYELAAAVRLLPKGITSRAQLKWKQARVTYATSRAKSELDWRPGVDMDEAMERTFRAYAEKYL